MLLVLFLDTEMVTLLEQQVPVERRHLTLAAWCLVKRLLDAVAEFSLNRVWRPDLVQGCKEAFSILQNVEERLRQQQQLASSHISTKFFPAVVFLT